jgi:methylthioribose-1-phosphate isomerase
VPIDTLSWQGDRVRMIDQTRLPNERVDVEIRTVPEMVEAIRSLRIRGAPAIGIAAAMGLVAALAPHRDDEDGFRDRLEEFGDELAAARPTAVNLSWAVARMKEVARRHADMAAAALWERLEQEALAIFEEDRRMCRRIGEAARGVIRERAGILTHCNAGGLATSGYGTALACAYVAQEDGKRVRVFADETRPLMQGSRLTAWELMEAGVDVTLICDDMTAATMARGEIDLVIVGADRIAANGDTANKIGTLGVAILAKHYGVPFFVAAPISTIDFSIASGKQIPIEQRDPREISRGFGKQTAPDGVELFNPAFDVTPAELIGAIITERGVAKAPYEQGLKRLL